MAGFNKRGRYFYCLRFRQVNAYYLTPLEREARGMKSYCRLYYFILSVPMIGDPHDVPVRT